MVDAAPRDAAVAQASLLARIDGQSWRETYDGLLSSTLLAGLDANPFHDRRYWERLLTRPPTPQWVWLIGPDEPVGLCHFREDAEGGGIVERLYLLRTAQRRGHGRRLMALAAGVLVARGRQPLTVWALECNLPARGFYEHLGGQPLPRRPVFEDAGAPVFEVGFRWDRPQSLAELNAPRW